MRAIWSTSLGRLPTTVLRAGQGTGVAKRAAPTIPHFFTHFLLFPHCFLTGSYFLCPQLLCPRPLDLPRSIAHSSMPALADDTAQHRQ